MIVGLNLLYLLPGVVGGTETYAAGLVHGLSRSPTSARFVVYVNEEAATWPLPDDPRFRRVVCPVRAVSRLARYRFEQFRLPGLAAADRLHLLHSLGYVAPLHLRCPSIVTVHDVHHLAHGRPSEWPRRVLLGQMVRRAVRRAAAVITDSGYMRGEIARAYGVSQDAIEVVWLAPSPGLNGRRAREPALMHPKDAGPYLLAFGGITPNKNLERLIEAYELARSRHGVTHRLVVVGRVPPSLPTGRAAGLETTGYLDEAALADVLARADALVFPSLYEGFGLPVVEAMAAGVPVACSAVTAMPEVAGDAAVYFDPHDVGEMASAIARLARDPALRRDLAARGRARAARFTWERTAEATLAIYERVLGRESATES